MRMMRCVKLAGSSILLAALLYAVLAAPGFLSDGASTVPIGEHSGEGQP